MSKKIRVLICDDHALFREGVKTILAANPEFEIIGEAEDGKEAVERATKLNPDVVLMDISMPVLKGFDATRRIKKERPELKVLILSVYDDEDLVARCLDAGASGYILKDSPPAQLTYAIQAVSHGQQYMSPRVLTSVVRQFIANPTETKSSYDLLSDREREILVLLAEGIALKDIARRLNLSVKTVEAHKYNLMRKLDLHDRSELIRYAIRKRLVEA
ncbi:MAG TPA: response regulator transcription factor [Bryobacteraceae bacterium]|nr:response regulator transcription factor [Bryobacteraceae bacterium]